MSRIYVIASYDSAPLVRAIHSALRELGHEPTSTWAEEAEGEEHLDGLSGAECLAIMRRNAADMDRASTILALGDSPMREGHMELERAISVGWHDIIHVGRPALSVRARPASVWFVATIEDALAALGSVRVERRTTKFDAMPGGGVCRCLNDASPVVCDGCEEVLADRLAEKGGE